MKTKFLLISIMSIISVNMMSQSWFPIDATWYFNIDLQNAGPVYWGGCEYETLTVVKDTIINDTAAKKLSVVHYKKSETKKGKDIYVCELDSKVYVWKGDQFKLQFDFNLEVGDQMDVKFNYSEEDFTVTPLKIDSITTIQLGEQNLRVQHASFTYTAVEDSGHTEVVSYRFLEKVGYEIAFEFTPVVGIDCLPGYYGLRCYEDEKIHFRALSWYHNNNMSFACDSIEEPQKTNITEVNKEIDFSISPNPSENYINVSVSDDNSENYSLEIFNMLGVRVKKLELIDSFTVDVSDLMSGLYFVKIYQNSKESMMLKLIKN